MKIQYTLKAIGLLLLLATAIPATATVPENMNTSVNIGARAAHLNNRLEEIRSLDKKELSAAEKRALRREVREIKKELAAISGGVYLSIGAILLIALLLILLL